MPSPSSPLFDPVPSAEPGLPPGQKPLTVRYKVITPAYERHARGIRLKNAAAAGAYLIPFWVCLIQLLLPEPFWEALRIGLERSGALAGGVLICLLWLNLRSEEVPAGWKDEEQLLVFDHTGLTFTTALQQTSMHWRAFRSWEEDAHGFTLQGYSPVFIPSSPFEPEVLTAFRDCLRANLWAGNR